MSEHILTEDIKKYLERTMNPVELLETDDHLAECDECLTKVKDSKNPENSEDLDILRASPEESKHLSYEQLENYVDEKSDEIEREVADVHFQSCAGCRAELKGLIEMRRLIEADLRYETARENAAPKSIPPRAQGFFAGWFRFRYGFAAAALLLLFVALFLLLKRDDSGSEQIAVAPPSPPDSNSTAILTDNSRSNADAPPVNNSNLPARAPEEDKTNEFPAVYQTEVQRALAANRLNFPADLNRLAGQRGELMDGATDSVPFALESPLGKIIQTDRPQFRWRALEGADGYIVKVYDAEFNRVAESPRVSAANWQIDRPLARGKIYVWQVTALKDGQEIKSPVRPAPDAKFKIIDAARLTELERLSREFRNEHLALGILYANAGLFDQAAREFQMELAKNPNSKAARKFLRAVSRQK